MSDKNNTCGNCEYLTVSGRKGNAFAWCEQTGSVVPHAWDGKINQFIFWRVPMECPRDDTKKSNTQAPEEDWIIKTFDQLTTA